MTIGNHVGIPFWYILRMANIFLSIRLLGTAFWISGTTALHRICFQSLRASSYPRSSRVHSPTTLMIVISTVLPNERGFFANRHLDLHLPVISTTNATDDDANVVQNVCRTDGIDSALSCLRGRTALRHPCRRHKREIEGDEPVGAAMWFNGFDVARNDLTDTPSPEFRGGTEVRTVHLFVSRRSGGMSATERHCGEH
jgi:hypothetical protein